MSLALLKKPLLVAVAATAMAVSLSPVSASAEESFGYRGFAFGTSVDVAGTITSGRTAVVTYGCGTPAGLERENSTAGINVPGLLSSGTIETTGATSASPIQSSTSATVQNVSLLDGLITATAVKSVATASNDGTDFAASAEGTTFANVNVLGLPVDVDVPPNTRILLPLIGSVTLNEQRPSVTGNSADMRVAAIHVRVTNALNPLGIPAGTNIFVAVATAGLSAPAGGFLGGFAYGTQVQAAGLLNSGPTFLATLPCAGTNGVVRDNTGAGLNLPLVLNSGTIQNTVQGSVTATTADGESTSTVEDLNVLNGLITATGVRSVATASRSGGVTTLSSEGSTFATITVDGDPLVVADIEPNTVINIPGVGRVILNQVITTATSIEVRAIHLIIEVGQIGGLPVGARVFVAVAKAIAR